jgi:hypothetical protein
MFTYDFIEKLGSVDTKISKCCLKCCPIKYLAHIEEIVNENEYKERLEAYLKDFRHEIQSLPFNLPTKQARRTFMNNLYDEFLLTKENLYLQLNKAVVDSYKCIANKKRLFKYYLPRFLQKKYLTKARQAYQKFDFVYNLQKDIIDNAIDILKTSAFNDGVELKATERLPEERVITDLSSPELSYFFYLALERVSIDNKFNRSNLSKLIASHFSTKMTYAPQPTQIRKHFTQVDDSVKKRVGKIFYDLSQMAKSN